VRERVREKEKEKERVRIRSEVITGCAVQRIEVVQNIVNYLPRFIKCLDCSACDGEPHTDVTPQPSP
jgi:hypothetical protein